MKKIVLSAAVILLFVIYAVHERLDAKKVLIQTNPTPIIPTSQSTMPNTMKMGMMYKDGSYIGDVKDAFYGNIQVKAVISGGKISDVVFLQYPNDRRDSIEINTQAMPYLKREAIQAQSANVDIVSGASDSSKAFKESLSSALAKAQ